MRKKEILRTGAGRQRESKEIRREGGEREMAISMEGGREKKSKREGGRRWKIGRRRCARAGGREMENRIYKVMF